MTWQPIETAPKDGTHIIALMYGEVIEAWWEDNYRGGDWECVVMPSHGCGCCGDRNADPTHWMPIPSKPEGV